MRIDKIALIIVLVFSLLGAFVSGTFLHELSHYQDFKEISTGKGEICALAIPTDTSLSSILQSKAGYYKFSIKPEDEIEYQRISKYSEIKAYAFDFVLILVVVICSIVILIKR
ncbi:MAG TPA: hypothetical protein P5277_02265 [Candidatus Paceibacterota bacterium]|nr:hypothetical protein [Candidatus Paceibacterota bacterium]